MMAHYDDEALVALLDGDAGADPHIAECVSCRESLDEYRAVTSCLGREAVWDLRLLKEEPVPETIANICAFADRMRAEDEAAIPLVAELLAGPKEEWMPRLLADDKYRTAGMVRKLMEASDKAIDVMPPDALEISALHTEIADHLDPESYPSDTVMKLRGNAWRDRGFCLYYVGRYADADLALLRSRKTLIACRIADYDTARVDIAAAFNAKAFEDLDGALRYAERARDQFVRCGDLEKTASAVVARAHSLMRAARAREALSDLVALLPVADNLSLDTHSRVLANIAYAFREIRDYGSALQYFEAAAVTMEASNSDHVERLRIQWNIAELLLLNGQSAEAERRLVRLIGEFERLEMHADAATAMLSIAELCVGEGRLVEGEVLCEKALRIFEQSGISSSVRARMALSYLKEAAQARHLTREKVQYVRGYVRDVMQGSPVLFAEPPA
jgi:tetratricopeptide (TPR) repeat protein